MYRDHTKEVQIGNVTIGGGNPIQNTVNDKYEDGRCGGDCCPDSCSRESRL